MDAENQQADLPAEAGQDGVPETERKAVTRLVERITSDAKFHEKAFKRMRENMKRARRGADDKWKLENYTANLTGRHINQKTAALYAKNPQAVARRRDRMDFQLWDGSPKSLAAAAEALTGAVDPVSGMVMPPDPTQAAQAQMLLDDVQQGLGQQEAARRMGKTLELMFAYFMAAQSPVEAKVSMKQAVRRALTCGVAYVKLGFQREYDTDPVVTQRLADFGDQLRHIQHMATQLQDPDSLADYEMQERELADSIEALRQREHVLLREGLIFDFPESTRIIPDSITKSLVGFVGARWITAEYLYTCDEVESTFGKKLKRGAFTAYYPNGTRDEVETTAEERDGKGEGMVRVWEHFDKRAGTVAVVCDGYPGYLRPPAAPDVYVDEFWPIYALTFNDVEDESELFPPSDVDLMADMQDEYNRSREGKRQHRAFAKPRLYARRGVLDDEDKTRLANLNPFDTIEVNIPDGANIDSIIGAIPVPGVDPNLYDVGEIFQDVQLVTGSAEAQFGATSKATATEAGIAEGSRAASVDSNIDDLDDFLTRIARACGKILMGEISTETAQKIAGTGAYWPEMTLPELAEEIMLEIVAGSSGKPNQEQEIRNWERMLPHLVTMPGIDPIWLARESLRRLDDRLDLDKAIAENMPAVVAQNRMAQATPADPSAAPDMQGAEGGDQGPRPAGGPPGTDAAMGNNQV